MSLRKRLYELFGNDIVKIDSKKVLLIGGMDYRMSYSLLSLIMGGFGFEKEITVAVISGIEYEHTIFDWTIRKISDLEKMIKEKFGISVEFIEVDPLSIYSYAKMIKPDIIACSVGGIVFSSLLSKYLPKSIVCYSAGDLNCVGVMAGDLRKFIRKKIILANHLQELACGSIGAILLSNILGSLCVYKAITSSSTHSRISLSQFAGILSPDYYCDIFIIGCGAVCNWFLEAYLSQLDFLMRMNIYERKYVGAPIINIYLFDFDTIEEHNVLRQPFFNPKDKGRKKVEVLKERIQKKVHLKRGFINVLSYDIKVDENSLDKIVEEIRNRNTYGRTYFFIFTDNKSGRYWSLEAIRRCHGSYARSVIVGGLSGKEFSSARVIKDSIVNLFKLEDLVSKESDVRASCTVQGGISFPHGVMGVLSTISMELDKFNASITIPGFYSQRFPVSLLFYNDKFRNFCTVLDIMYDYAATLDDNKRKSLSPEDFSYIYRKLLGGG